jgi:2-methylisocitrate lyase-like PEP mutase family enzyme
MSLNSLAQTLKSLHKPGQPFVVANVYDVLSARAVASLPSCKALGTASYSVASANSTADDDLQLETNLSAIPGIVAVANEFKKPLTVDIQDAYGNRLEEAIAALIDLGVVGVNVEDCDKANKKMYSPEVAAERVKRALTVAKHKGVPDFVVNARCDALVQGGEFDEVLVRGRQYIAAGATTVFVWGGKRGVSRDEVQTMVKEFDGRLNVMMLMGPNGFGVVESLEWRGSALDHKSRSRRWRHSQERQKRY